MARFFHFIGAQLQKALNTRVLPFSPPTLRQVTAGLALLGVLALIYLYGAAVMYFQLPSSDFLDKCFGGIKDWQPNVPSPIPTLAVEKPKEVVKKGITVDRAEKTSDGFTLYTATDGARALLLDMRGTVVHRWELPFSQAWPEDTPQVRKPLADDWIHWVRCRLYPNGDLLAIYHAGSGTPYGYGLVKVDKDSKLLWDYANNVHHDVDVDEDGTIYTLTQKMATMTETRANNPPTASPKEPHRGHMLTDFLVVLSPAGHELQKISLVGAFRNSPYLLALASADAKLAGRRESDLAVNSTSGPPSAAPDEQSETIPFKGELLHANSVRVMPRALAAQFPLFKPGQVLISLGSLDLLVVVDPKSRSVVWACGGVWQAQRDAEFLKNGRLLLYDNRGAFHKGVRILEYDPLTQAIPWYYLDAKENSTPFHASLRGAKQRLPNGNTLIVDPDHTRLFEVTQDKEVVWEFFCPSPPVSPGHNPRRRAVTGAWRYRPEELTFLKKEVRARP